MRTRLIAATVFMGLFAFAVWATAQAIAVRPVPPTIVFGGDVGFRIEGDRAGTPIGRLVVKRDGRWIGAELGSVKGTEPVSQR